MRSLYGAVDFEIFGPQFGAWPCSGLGGFCARGAASHGLLMCEWLRGSHGGGEVDRPCCRGALV